MTAIFQAVPGTIAPVNGIDARAQLNNVLSYTATEVHTSIASLFNPSLAEDVKTYFRAASDKKLAFLESNIVADKQFVVGDVADAYLYIVLTWTGYLSIDLVAFPRVKAYLARIGSLETVKAAHARIATNPRNSI